MSAIRSVVSYELQKNATWISIKNLNVLEKVYLPTFHQDKLVKYFKYYQCTTNGVNLGRDYLLGLTNGRQECSRNQFENSHSIGNSSALKPDHGRFQPVRIVNEERRFPEKNTNTV